MAPAVYALCAAASAACAITLGWIFWEQRGRTGMLVLWTSLSFMGFAVSNGLVFVDLVLLPSTDLAVARAATACASSLLLLVGLIFERT